MRAKEINWPDQLKKEVLKRAGARIDQHAEGKDYSRVWLHDGSSLLVADFGLGAGPMAAHEIGKDDALIYRTIEDLALFYLPFNLANSIAKVVAAELNEPYQPLINPFHSNASIKETNNSARDVANA